jgi:hypothetical protein
MPPDPLTAGLADLLGARSVLQAHQRADESLTETARRLVEEAKRPRVIELPASPLCHLKTPKQIAEACPGLTQCASTCSGLTSTAWRLM